MTRFIVSVLIALLTAGCALSPDSRDDLTARIAPWALASTSQAKPTTWLHFKLPGKKPSHFDYAFIDNRSAIAANAQSSASMLRQVMKVQPADLGNIKFSWKLPELIQYADMSLREFDDSPVRVILAFEGDRTIFSAKNSMLSELAQLLTGEPMPYATLMYVWCNECEPEKVILNPHTDRIRKLPLESGTEKLNRWMNYERNVRADFVKTFGEEPGVLTSISIMTDTDNTKSVARAWYGPVSLLPIAKK